ncbi:MULTISPECIES: ROK family protein [unclassified Arthrobacter]|uniref:ROK family protein n=1 Tax=unclassified Arthrobacter TaxID=235627 RepID=UPI002882DEEE|nr:MULTISPECIES: ROK family protein [unclassified Arthrobacter]
MTLSSTPVLPAPHPAEHSATQTVRIGVDIGGTKIEAVAIDQDCTVLHTVRRPTGFGNEALLSSLFGVLDELRGAENLADCTVSGLGIGIPGTVNTESGYVANAVNVGVAGVDLGNLVAAEQGLPVAVENDVNAAAIGAHYLLADASGSSAYLNLGTGLAAGYVSNGVVVRGTSGAAGEIGHLPLGLQGEECPCGQAGCLELIASGSGIARQWRGDGQWPAVSLFEAALDGDPVAKVVQQRFFEGAATAIRILGLTYDPSAIYIGGGLNALGQPLLSGIQRELARFSAPSPFLSGLALGDRVQLVPPGLSIGSVGAAIAAD